MAVHDSRPKALASARSDGTPQGARRFLLVEASVRKKSTYNLMLASLFEEEDVDLESKPVDFTVFWKKHPWE